MLKVKLSLLIGLRVPKPLKDLPESEHDRFCLFLADPSSITYYTAVKYVDLKEKFYHQIKRGLIHFTSASAGLHGEALASFTSGGIP